MGGARLVAGLEAAGVRTFVRHCHTLDLDGEVTVVAVHQGDARVQRPLVRPREQDVGAVEPGLLGDLIVDLTP